MSFVELLQEIKTTTLEAYAHQEVPFEKVVDAVVKERDMSRSPLFQVVFDLDNTPEIPELHLGQVELSLTEHVNTTSKFEISLSFTETDNGLRGSVEYNTDLYNAETIRSMFAHFKALLYAIVADPGQSIGLLSMLSESEEEQLLVEFNDTQAAYAKDKSIVDLFEVQAAETPNATAIVFEEAQLTYKELNERSNQVARYLQKQGVKAETPVPICLERSPEMVVGILGILKAGGAYVPVDPEYPEERISYMLEDTGAKLVLSSKAGREKLNGNETIKIIALDGDREQINKESSGNLKTVIRANQLAYVIYTSGSTGKPKGVMIEHGNAGSFMAWCRQEFAPARFDIVYAATSICFDLSVFELFYPLSSGKPVRIVENGLAISKYLANDSNILINAVPSVIGNLLNEKADLSRVSAINMAGEPVPPGVLERLDTTRTAVRNLYGPTEDTTYSTMSLLEKGKPVTIGKPVWNTRIYILSSGAALSPVGVTGEICIAGAGLARGYLNNEELTAEKFIIDPFSKEAGARLYRTGDLGRWLPDGNIEYLGRTDDQVKIRGYRIELGEIESVLNQSGLVSQAVVLARADSGGNKRLAGYIVPKETFDKQAVQNYLRAKLPEYMVPALWVELERIPLTPNGKTDRKALPDPEITNIVSEYAAPRNETEAKLAAIWQELLGIGQVGIYDNFFELGGDSILTIQVVSRMRRSGYLMQPKDLFNYQEIAGLSKAVGRSSESGVSGEQGILSGTFGLTPIQAWYLEQEPSAVSHFNQSVLLKIGKGISAETLQGALGGLRSQHDALRLSFKKKEGVWEQEYGTGALELDVEDLRDTAGESLAAEIRARSDKYQRSLSVEEGIVMRMVWLQTPEKEESNRLLLVIHHLAVDGVSWRILLEDLEQLLGGDEVSLGNKSSSYRQWHSALINYGQSRRLQGQKEYWWQVAGSYISLPEDHAYKGKVLQKDMRDYQVRLGDKQTRQLLQEAPKVYHTEINDLLLGALSAALCGWTGKGHVVIGLEGHGREAITGEIDSSRTAGWFTSLYPVLLKGGSGAGTLIREVKEALRRVPDKGLGYGVLKYIERAPALQGRDPWDIIFNYLGQLDTAVGSGRWLAAAGEGSGKAGKRSPGSRIKAVGKQLSSWR